MCVQYIGGGGGRGVFSTSGIPLVHREDILSTYKGMFSASKGYHDSCGGYHEYIGGILAMSTSGENHDSFGEANWLKHLIYVEIPMYS